MPFSGMIGPSALIEERGVGTNRGRRDQMAQAVQIEVPFEQLLEAVDRLDTRERELLRERLIQREEEALIQQAEQAAHEFKLADLPPRLSYWSVEKVLDELRRKLEAYEQKFGMDSKAFYTASKGRHEKLDAERAKWLRLYEIYHRLRAAKRQVDIKAGRVVEPLPVGEVVSKQPTPAELEERLREFEKRHGISSAEFYERFKRGEAGDSQAVFEWVHTYVAYMKMTEVATQN